jgi:hypothetical protein
MSPETRQGQDESKSDRARGLAAETILQAKAFSFGGILNEEIQW